MTLLSLQDIHAGYGELRILRGINLHIDPNEIVALIGPNGAGKSTVIKSIYNIANVSQGHIYLNGTDITKTKTHELITQGISYVNQGRIIFNNLTIKENLTIGAAHPQTQHKNLAHVYEKFPVLREREHNLAYGLSGGQRQMLALGRALMQQPKLLLLDEPSLGLSPKLQTELFKTIQSLRDDGISILIVEQNAKQAIHMANRTYLLENGKIALTGGTEILDDPKIKHIYLGGHY